MVATVVAIVLAVTFRLTVDCRCVRCGGRVRGTDQPNLQPIMRAKIRTLHTGGLHPYEASIRGVVTRRWGHTRKQARERLTAILKREMAHTCARPQTEPTLLCPQCRVGRGLGGWLELCDESRHQMLSPALIRDAAHTLDALKGANGARVGPRLRGGARCAAAFTRSKSALAITCMKAQGFAPALAAEGRRRRRQPPRSSVCLAGLPRCLPRGHRGVEARAPSVPFA